MQPVREHNPAAVNARCRWWRTTLGPRGMRSSTGGGHHEVCLLKAARFLEEITYEQQNEALNRVLRQYLDPFRVLQLNPDATEQDIEIAYRKVKQ